MNYTLAYSESVDGWTSFFSYYPEMMIGMNNYLYSFKGGNLFRHNTNAVRNNFYGVQYTSKLQSVFNESPLENKLFKTINIEGDDAWSVLMQTDIQTDGYIEKAWFEKKEQAYYAFVRNSGTVPATLDDYVLRSLNGIGKSSTISYTVNTNVKVSYSISPLIAIESMLSVGDILYYALSPTYSTPLLFGTIKSKVVDYPSGNNYITVDASITGATIPSVQNPYLLYIKNSVAESHGVLGHYCVFDIENTNTNKVELFVVSSDIMKSNP